MRYFFNYLDINFKKAGKDRIFWQRGTLCTLIFVFFLKKEAKNIPRAEIFYQVSLVFTTN